MSNARVRRLSLKAKALQWLAQREHSHQELERKLLHWLENESRGPRGADGRPLADAHLADTPRRADVQAADDRRTEVQQLLQELTEAGLLNAQRFIESRLHVRASRFGNLRIRAELAHHGLRLDDADKQALQASELSRALAVLKTRFGSAHCAESPLNALEASELRRRQRFLASRGFSAQTISRALKLPADSEPAPAD
ncbi:MAG: regulatory protein RecX [Rubrivivax sp.]|nr:regulatory protein RecX [Rubrivivax sp.]